eukprot:TRINITY_DN33995_c0_g1_i1.p1 TRINITY_DN33995_c0_g1~~TRINITY_DN33995_c0_g1_i1.p1  ORF type:complete len:338 (+),score=37.92 TRINITY_DN33995_c0_g1_i1:117-1130(+)
MTFLRKLPLPPMCSCNVKCDNGMEDNNGNRVELVEGAAPGALPCLDPGLATEVSMAADELSRGPVGELGAIDLAAKAAIEGFRILKWDVEPGFEGKWPDRGHGVLRKMEESEYRGQFLDGKPHGQGAYSFAHGETYQGQFQVGKMQGEGRYTHADGSYYHGQWFDNHKHGTGRQYWPDGSCYDGEFRTTKHGVGKFFNSKRELIYSGQFCRDKMHGHGVYKFADGRTYHGHWRSGRRNGEGTMEFPDGSMYQGQWENGKKHGHGIIVDPSGAHIVGRWSHGQEVHVYSLPESTRGNDDAIPEEGSVRVRLARRAGLPLQRVAEIDEEATGDHTSARL